MKTFQQPLTKSEEEVYLARLQEKDETIRNEAKQILIERNLRLVAHVRYAPLCIYTFRFIALRKLLRI